MLTTRNNQPLVSDAQRAAHVAAQHRIPPPVALHSVAHGVPFLIDGSPGLLFARVRDDMPVSDAMPVVVISCTENDGRDVGRVFGLSPRTSVRPVQIVAPLQVRWVY